jgi:hypothetical protein
MARRRPGWLKFFEVLPIAREAGRAHAGTPAGCGAGCRPGCET